MVSDIEVRQLEIQKLRPFLLARYYQSYRQWRKSKGRRIKARKCLQKMVDFYSHFVKKGDLCFDIGANVGNRTEAFQKLGATVVAIEPQQDCVSILKKRFYNQANVHIVQKAVGETVGQRDIFIASSSTLSSMSENWIKNVKQSGRFSEEVWDKKETVETTTLDQLIEEYGRPAFCKIDVEGFEYNVLLGLSEPVSVMSFEFHPEFIQCAVNCVRYLLKLGTAKFNYSEGESMSIALSAWVEPDEIINILTSLPKDGKIFGDVYVQFCGN